MKLPETWIQARLTDVCELNPGADSTRPPDPTPVSFVPMSAVDEVDGVIKHPHVRPYAEVSKGYTSFKENDVLFAKVTPCMENGKAAIARELENGLGFGSTEFHVLRASDELLPELLLSFLRQEAFRQRAAAAFVGTGGLQRVPQDFLARVRMPLPTVPEQERIVELLRHVNSVVAAKRLLADKVAQLVSTAYWEHFGSYFSPRGIIDPVRVGEIIEDTQYGISDALGADGSHAILRMNSITSDGWLDLSDLKHSDLSSKQAASTDLRNGDILFNRTNSRELVGKCAIWRAAPGQFSFASYLVRLRLTNAMLPEFLWATLNSAYGKYRLFNAAKQAVSMANVSPTDLSRIPVPLPPLEVQRSFAVFVREVEDLRRHMLIGLGSFEKLSTVAAQQGLTGSLTSDWRTANIDDLHKEASTREGRFRERGLIPSIEKSAVAASPVSYPDSSVTRSWLLGEMSNFQRQVFLAFSQYAEGLGRPLIVEDVEEFTNFCDDELVSDRLRDFGPALTNRIRRCLSQLSSLGLIAKVVVPRLDVETGKRDYLKAFRPLRGSDLTRMADLQQLQIPTESSEQTLQQTILVHIDEDVAERAGAGGHFQVISLEDEAGNDITDLIDVGRFYASAEELRQHLAEVLGVSVRSLDLEFV